MRQIILIGMVVLGISAWGLAEPASIADVHTIQDLRDASSIHVSDDWDIRLGISDGGDDAGPWGLIYCLAESKTGAALPDGKAPGKQLGPVYFKCEYSDHHENIKENVKKLAQLRGSNSGLYCMTIPLAWEGTCHVNVLSQSGEVLATKDIKIEKPRPCYWANFAALSKAAGGSPCVMPGDAAAAMIQFAEGRPMVTDDKLNLVEMPNDVESNPLPGDLPVAECWFPLPPTEDEKYPLVLSLNNNMFVIHCDGIKMTNWPDECLLARWWVNDKLIEAPRAKKMAQAVGRHPLQTNEMRVTAGFPDYLGELHAGDVVSVQVLYSPAAVESIFAQQETMLRLAAFNNPGMLLESNRLDIKITPELLVNRPATTQPAN